MEGELEENEPGVRKGELVEEEQKEEDVVEEEVRFPEHWW